MAWTNPKTFVANDPLTAAELNTHLRDNLLETAPGKVTTAGDIVYATAANTIARLGAGGFASTVANWWHKRKTADESVTSSTTLQNDDHLVFSLGANETWIGRGILAVYSDSATPDFKMDFSVPTGATGAWRAVGGQDAAAVAHTANGIAFTTATSFIVDNAIRTLARIDLYIVLSSTAGDLQLRWAQSTSDGTAVIVKAGSFIELLRVA